MLFVLVSASCIYIQLVVVKPIAKVRKKYESWVISNVCTAKTIVFIYFLLTSYVEVVHFASVKKESSIVLVNRRFGYRFC